MIAKVRKMVVEVAKACMVVVEVAKAHKEVAGVAKVRKTVAEKVVEVIAVLRSRRAIAVAEFAARLM